MKNTDILIPLVLVLSLLVVSCDKSKKLFNAMIPVAPSTGKIAQAVDGATDSAEKARTEVQTAKEFTQVGNAKSAHPHLETADTQLGDALQQLSKAHQEIEDYKVAVSVRDRAIDATAKDNAKLKKENQKLKDAFTKKIRTVLGVVAGVLMLAGLFCVASKFIPALAFFPGFRLSLPLLLGSAVVGYIAVNLSLIMFWTGIVLGVALLASAVWGFIHLLNYKPAKRVVLKDLWTFKKTT